MAERLLTTAEITAKLGFTFTVTGSVTISGAASASGAVNLTATAHGLTAGTALLPLLLLVSGVAGTTEANGLWPVSVPDANHLTLTGSTFANAYTSGGIAKVVTITGGIAATLTPEDLINLLEMVKRAPSAPNTALSTVLSVTP